MDHIDQVFGALGRRINALPAPVYRPHGSVPLATLIDRVNHAKRHYDPALHR